MELYQRKAADGSLLSPYWYYDVSVSGRRVRKSTKERTRAKAQKVMVDALRVTSDEAKAGPKRITLRNAMLAYAEDLKIRGKSFRILRMLADKTFAADRWASMGVYGLPQTLMVDELTEAHIEKFKTERAREGIAVGTIGHEVKAIRSAVLLAARQGNLRPQEMRYNVPLAPAKTRWLTVEEWHAVYSELDPLRPIKVTGAADYQPSASQIEDRVSARDLFVALTMCGGRWGEVSRMTADQVVIDGDTGIVRVRLYGWKTDKERMVPAPPMMADMLLRRVAAARVRGKPYLFPSTSRKPSVKPRDWLRSSRIIREAFNRAKINEGHIVGRLGTATVHSLRHTFASWLRQDGMSLGDIQELLGHEQESMTRRYAHIAPNVTVDAASQVISQRINRATTRVSITTQEESSRQTTIPGEASKLLIENPE